MKAEGQRVKKAVQQIMLAAVTKSEGQARESLQAVKEAGYDGIELNGFMIRPTSMLVRLLTKTAGMPVGRGGNWNWKNLLVDVGLCCVGIHEDLGTICRNPEAIIGEAKHFDTDKIIVTGMYRFDYSSRREVKALAQRLNDAGKALKKEGIQLLYHNHNAEFLKIDSGQTAFELLIEKTDPDYIGFELDSYWAAEAGASPEAWMRRLKGRLKLYHINDRGSRSKGRLMTPIVKNDSMELGCGNMELKELLRLAQEEGVAAVVLESHRNWRDNSPIKSLQVSAKFLKEHMWE